MKNDDSLLPSVGTEQLELVSGGATCSVFNYGGPAQITPEGGSVIDVPSGTSRFPGVAGVPQGKFGLKVGDRTFRDRSGNPASFGCEGQQMAIVPGPNDVGPGLFGAR